MAYEPVFNSSATVQLQRLGNELQPILIIDDPILEPEVLVDLAASSEFGPPNSAYYPGLNAPVPESYLNGLVAVMRPSLERAFGIAATRNAVAMGFFALATHELCQFGPLQRIPHYDQLNPDCLAVVHYLCHDQGGGTGFFRHKATGYESVDPSRREAYRASVDGWVAKHGDELTTWSGPQTPGFEMTGQADIRFNRLIIYRSNVLHCALFDGANMSADPRVGRLTANSFIGAR